MTSLHTRMIVLYKIDSYVLKLKVIKIKTIFPTIPVIRNQTHIDASFSRNFFKKVASLILHILHFLLKLPKKTKLNKGFMNQNV